MSKGRSSYSHIRNYMCIKRDNVGKLKQQSRNQRSVFLCVMLVLGGESELQVSVLFYISNRAIFNLLR